VPAHPRVRAPFPVELDSSPATAPRWLRDAGTTAWLLVGLAAVIVGVALALGVASAIVGPVLMGGVVAAVASPAVGWLQEHRVPRALGAGIMLLALVAIAIVILLLVLGGIVAEGDKIAAALTKGVDRLRGWAESVGVDNHAASAAATNVESAGPSAVSTLLTGVAHTIRGIASLAFQVSFTAFAIFFLLKDGRALRRWANGHLGVPRPVAETITSDVIQAIRRYFLGVTIVAGFNAVVVGLGALALGVPLAGTIAVVTLVTAYVPFVGAVVAGAFAVLLALGSQGAGAAVAMLVIVILANGLLQNIVQPIAMGATLRMNPLLILVVTIGAGAFFGTLGMILAAPLTSAGFRISADLRRARADPDLELARISRPSPAAAGGDAGPAGTPESRTA
jgi:putative heme transporter